MGSSRNVACAPPAPTGHRAEAATAAALLPALRGTTRPTEAELLTLQRRAGNACALARIHPPVQRIPEPSTIDTDHQGPDEVTEFFEGLGEGLNDRLDELTDAVIALARIAPVIAAGLAAILVVLTTIVGLTVGVALELLAAVGAVLGAAAGVAAFISRFRIRRAEIRRGHQDDGTADAWWDPLAAAWVAVADVGSFGGIMVLEALTGLRATGGELNLSPRGHGRRIGQAVPDMLLALISRLAASRARTARRPQPRATPARGPSPEPAPTPAPAPERTPGPPPESVLRSDLPVPTAPVANARQSQPPTVRLMAEIRELRATAIAALTGKRLGPRLGTGDQARVYAVPDHPELAVKVFKRSTDESQRFVEAAGLTKLAAAGLPSTFLTTVKWLDHRGRQVTGLLLRRIDGFNLLDWALAAQGRAFAPGVGAVTQRTLDDLRRIRDVCASRRLAVRDFQAMVSARDGAVTLADPRKVTDVFRHPEHQNELVMTLEDIDNLIDDVARALLAGRASQPG